MVLKWLAATANAHSYQSYSHTTSSMPPVAMPSNGFAVPPFRHAMDNTSFHSGIYYISISLLSRQSSLNQAFLSFLSCSLCSSSSTIGTMLREHPPLPWSSIITGPMNCSPGMPITKSLSVAARRRIRGLRFHWSVMHPAPAMSPRPIK